MPITDEQISAAWDATKRVDQPVYNELPFITRGLLRRRADRVFELGVSNDPLWRVFEQALIPSPLPVEVMEELVEEVVEEFEPPPKGEDYVAPELPQLELVPDPPAPEPEPPKKRATKKKAEPKVEKPVKVVKATKKAVKK